MVGIAIDDPIIIGNEGERQLEATEADASGAAGLATRLTAWRRAWRHRFKRPRVPVRPPASCSSAMIAAKRRTSSADRAVAGPVAVMRRPLSIHRATVASPAATT